MKESLKSCLVAAEAAWREAPKVVPVDLASLNTPSEVTMELRPILNPLFKSLDEPISDFTFIQVYLFRKKYDYKVAYLGDGHFLFTGTRDGMDFFMLPFGLPREDTLKDLLKRYSTLISVTASKKDELEEMGLTVTEDRDNFDYVYSTEELSTLKGRRFHKKKNLVNAFLKEYSCEAKAFKPALKDDALEVLLSWRADKFSVSGDEGDFYAAKEALERSSDFGLCGAVYYIDGKPVAYTLGEEVGERGDTYIVHFEKGLAGYKGLLQYVNTRFASLLPGKVKYINREQDLGLEGLRRSKLSYRPVKLLEKYKVTL